MASGAPRQCKGCQGALGPSWGIGGLSGGLGCQGYIEGLAVSVGSQASRGIGGMRGLLGVSGAIRGIWVIRACRDVRTH